MPQIGPAEILVILLVGLLVFGPKRLPEIGRQVGRGMRELKKFQDTVKGEFDQVMNFHDDDDTLGYSPPEDQLPTGDPIPPALPPVAPQASATVDPPANAERPASRAPSRFRAPRPRPTT